MKGRANIVVGILVVLVVVASLGAYFVMQSGTGASDDLRAVVHDSDGNVHELALSHDRELVVTTDLGTNVVVVEDGGVYVREADCANQDCVHQGRIENPGRQIICLPHKLWVEVVGGEARGGVMDVDAVADEAESAASSADASAGGSDAGETGAGDVNADGSDAGETGAGSSNAGSAETDSNASEDLDVVAR